jgi:predicted dithiol-disulfide oxidoreductase (DUF899 family)
MTYHETIIQLSDHRQKLAKIRAEMRALQATITPQPVENYVFEDTGGKVTLADLFGEKPDLFVIHNMGKSCPYCTLWADGFNGVLHHLENRAAFAVTSPDDPLTQRDFAQSRSWRFRMASQKNTSFAADMGYRTEKGYQPGVSVFTKTAAGIHRVSDTAMGPDDDFCTVWHFFDLLPSGPDGWRPRYAY